ncbi:alpha/beta hydrolase [Nocardioides marmoriginsengisoli]|uniref:Alpha/beta hydrolase n=1 Tax=Nocardioides marmoriginsengisoli TaxID=661483 RepID=A0A3N0CLU2_9ACTN|nr:alpha/beta hydrolase [Nocardioides marmoriginsengisoli]RNL64370.1 alpha/beta hydrolase [Nocardioides marmoriginsengisoli]
MADIARPRLEGSVAVRGERRLSFAEFGTPRGAAVFWLHGTPGGRRQVPLEARQYAEQHDVRIIGIDRPGIGTSTPHLYDEILDWTGDLAVLADNLGIDTFRVIGLSGGGPYALAAGAALPERVHGVGVLGGVAPTKGVDAIRGGLVEVAPYAAPVVGAIRIPLSYALAAGIRLAKPFASAAIGGYAAFQPRGDRELLGRPEFKAMFLDDLINGARYQVGAPLADLILFTRYWGFDAADVNVPVRWWHGDDDHIIPHAHGVHMVERLPDAEFATIQGESHLGGMGVATEVLQTLMELGPRKPARKKAAGAQRR